jgi:hypothetical protein
MGRQLRGFPRGRSHEVLDCNSIFAFILLVFVVHFPIESGRDEPITTEG